MQWHKTMVALAAVIMLSVSGCASFKKTQPAPKLSQKIQVEYSNEGLSGWSDLPMGVHRVPGSQVIVSGHQKNGAGFMFGLIGVAVESAVNSSAGEDRIGGNTAELRVNLNQQAQDITRQLLSAQGLEAQYTLSAAAGQGRLVVTPAIVLNFVNQTDARPYVFLKAELLSPGSNSTVWATNYVASNGAARKVRGDDSWTSEGGAPLKENLTESLTQAIRVMLTDVQTPYPRNPAAMKSVSVAYPHLQAPMAFSGYVLGEDERYLYFVPKIGDASTIAGVHVIDKRVTLGYQSEFVATPVAVATPAQTAATPIPQTQAPSEVASIASPTAVEPTPAPTAAPQAAPALTPAASTPTSSQGKWWNGTRR